MWKALTIQHAQVWTTAIAPISSTNAIAMCVPAVAIAAANSFDIPENKCPGLFHPTLKVEGGSDLTKGLWQARAPPIVRSAQCACCRD